MFYSGGADVSHEPQKQLREVRHLQPPAQASEAAARLLEGHPARLKLWFVIINVSIIVNSVGYIGALESGHEQVVNSALNNLPEFAVLCQVNPILIIFVRFLKMSLFRRI